MCQQTQVATVIDYYNRWMKRWPTVQSLATATIEEVNEMWSGLGYYSRGRRLWEGAKKVVDELDGQMPKTADSLQKLLPGVGRYTSCAIASISFGERVGVVDGNVIRVMSRLRAIGAESQQPATMDRFWSLADQVVDPDRPGDCNQALMELGATVCSPKTPSCSTCPLQSVCKAYSMTKSTRSSSCQKFFSLSSPSPDVKKRRGATGKDSSECGLCIPADQWDSSAGVCNFPRKAKKKAPLKEDYVTAVVSRHCVATGGNEYFLAKRRGEGLLAGLWEFPCLQVADSSLSQKASHKLLTEHLRDACAVDIRSLKSTLLGEVSHTFSHRLHTYHVYSIQLAAMKSESCTDELGDSTQQQSVQWVEDINSVAISTAVRKIMALVTTSTSKKKTASSATPAKRKHATKDTAGGSSNAKRTKTATLDSFVKKEKKA
ncbi:adenine DNA glycosylase-like isoform X2 [Sycon ciliatum]